MTEMNVLDYIDFKLEREKLHMTLIDPDRQTPKKAGEIAKIVSSLGTDAIMVGGSTGVTQKSLDETVLAIRRNTDLPLILFPTSAKVISKYVDAIYFMSLLNSKTVQHVIREQMKAAPVIKKMGIEPISMGYLVIEPGMKVGEVGEAEILRRDNVKEAVKYALAAKYLGMRLLYLEAGSGAPEPVPGEMIKAVKKETDIPLIVGGGLRTEDDVKKVLKAGADIVVTGTLIEQFNHNRAKIERIIKVVKETKA